MSVFAFTLVLCWLPVALGWWQLGHILVAQIAMNTLQKSANIQSQDGTAGTDAFNKFNQLVDAFKGFTDGKSNTFPEASVWPDDIKSNGVLLFNNYHFINIIHDPENTFKGMTDLQRDINSVNTVGWCMSVLKTNKDGITFERAFMARYLLHMVGDIHQPLHSSLMYNSTFKTGDQGGNLIKVTTVKNEATNLHSFMDSMAGEQPLNETLVRPLNDSGWAYVKGLASAITAEYPASSFGALVNDPSPLNWSLESFALAKSELYQVITNNAKLTDEFTDKMYALCRKQVALAGYRLANMINLVYS